MINVGSLADIAKRLFTISLDYQDIRLIFVTENEFDNSSSEVITYDYLMELEEINNLEINNIAKLLKIDFKEVNYNSFVKHMVDIFKTKQNCDIDIYQTAEYTINLNKQEIKITNYNFNQQENTHVILFLDNESKNITGSIIDDVDVNYVYKNYIKYPGNM